LCANSKAAADAKKAKEEKAKADKAAAEKAAADAKVVILPNETMSVFNQCYTGKWKVI
jgi:hypothetical protein